MTDSWVNLNRGRGDFNKLHMHLPALFSGVYYAQPPNDAADRLNGGFVLPLTTGEASDADGEPGSSEVTYALMRPARGMLMLFPAGMLHAVLPSWAAEGEVRISIGFNVSPFW